MKESMLNPTLFIFCWWYVIGSNFKVLTRKNKVLFIYFKYLGEKKNSMGEK
jgi:hypothetical protein